LSVQQGCSQCSPTLSNVSVVTSAIVNYLDVLLEDDLVVSVEERESLFTADPDVCGGQDKVYGAVADDRSRVDLDGEGLDTSSLQAATVIVDDELVDAAVVLLKDHWVEGDHADGECKIGATLHGESDPWSKEAHIKLTVDDELIDGPVESDDLGIVVEHVVELHEGELNFSRHLEEGLSRDLDLCALVDEQSSGIDEGGLGDAALAIGSDAKPARTGVRVREEIGILAEGCVHALGRSRVLNALDHQGSVVSGVPF
jgi:hypothetical protein